MLSISALSGDKGNYYLALARDDYFLKGGEPAGQWIGEGASLLGLTGRVEEQACKNLLAGLSADGSDFLVQGAGGVRHQPGWDLSFSCPKSVSVLWSQAERDVQKTIQEAQAEAVRAALDYLQDAAAYTRVGKGGTVRIPAKLVVAAFEHGTSRAQDPQLHTHCLIMNVGVPADGKTRTILSQPLYAHKMAAGAVYRAELSNQLEKRLGVVLERQKTCFEVQGVPDSLVEEFSKRRQQIEDALAKAGGGGAKVAEKLTLATRPAKGHLPRGELMSAWQEVAREHGFTAADVDRLLERQGHRHDLAGRADACIQLAALTITKQASHFPERELVRHAAVWAQTLGVASSALRVRVKEALARSPDFVRVGESNGEIRYTTREMLALEKKMLGHVEQLKALPSQALPEKTIRSVEGRLSEEQKQALRHVTQAKNSIQVVSGMAGTGKTSMLRATREAFEKEGFNVIGACLSGKAAEGLEEGAGIKSTTLAKLIGAPELGYSGILGARRIASLEQNPSRLRDAALEFTPLPEPVRLPPRTVLVVDEAGMVGTRQMERITEEALKAGARLVLVGDERQLQAIDAGGPFASLGNRCGRAILTEIQRQREPWAREAVKKFAEGEAIAALGEYACRGLVAVAEDRDAAMHALMRAWKREGAANPRDHLILASTNKDSAILNRMAQVQRTLAGALGTQAVSAGGSDFHCGDRVLFTRNSKRYGVQNGSLGTVIEVDVRHQCLTVKLDGGKLALISVEDYAHLRLGYALTTHKAQGATTENAYVLLGGSCQDRELSYVQASRARGDTRFFVNKLDGGEQFRELHKQVERSRQKDLAHDVLEQQGKRYVESRNILVQRIE